MPFVYILKSICYDKTYIGSTINLEKRLKEHNAGKSTFSKKYKPWNLVYREFYNKLSDARLREKYLKNAAGRRFIKKEIIVPG